MNKTTNVLFIWNPGKALKKHFKKVFEGSKNIRLIFPKSFSKDRLKKYYEAADVIVGWRPDFELLKTAAKLKLFINPGTGVKHLIDEFRELSKTKKVILSNGHGHSYSVAQHTAAMLFSLMNKIVNHHNYMRDGIWRMSDDKDVFTKSVTLKNKKIGLLGYGAINRHVLKFLSGFEVEFHICKRKLSKNKIKKINGRKVFFYGSNELHKFLKAVDILIIALPHTSETENMIGGKELKLLGKGSLLVNVARGSIVSEKSLYNALNKKIIGGAALDVWYDYNPEEDSSGKKFPFGYPFQNLNNIVMSPHRAASPFDEVGRWYEVIENIRRADKGRKDFLNIVDVIEEY